MIEFFFLAFGPEVLGTATVVAFWIDVVIRVFAVVWLPRNRSPQSAVAWLLLIMLLPVPGFLLFAVLGSTNRSRRRRRRQASMDQRIREAAAGTPGDASAAAAGGPWSAIAAMNTRLGSLPLRTGGSVVLHDDPSETITALTRAVRGARRSVHAQFYITVLDDETERFFEALVDARERGVEVRVLIDHLASRPYPRWRELRRRLRRADIEWRLLHPFRPLRGQIARPDLRNHRKLLVVDGEVAFAGSQNLVDRRYDVRKTAKAGHTWIDLTGEFIGPAVAQLDAVFATDWYTETGEHLDLLPGLAAPDPEVDVDGPQLQVLPSGPGFDHENGLALFVALLYRADERVRIVSPYFVPDETLRAAMVSAAVRGVQVELVVGATGDHPVTWRVQCSYYEELLRAGVRILEYPGPVILHTKCMTVDGEVAVIGSSNMDIRSFSLNRELSVMAVDGAVTASVDDVVDGYVARCTAIDPGAWARRPVHRRFLEHAARLTSDLH